MSLDVLLITGLRNIVMASFRSAKSQAAHVMKQLQGRVFKSIGTVRNYEERLTQIAKFLQNHRMEEGFKNKC